MSRFCFGAVPACVLFLAGVTPAQAAPGDTPTASREIVPVRKVALEGSGLPPIVVHRSGPSLVRLDFQGDSKRLFFVSNVDAAGRVGRWRPHAIEVATGAVADHTPSDGTEYVGAAEHGPLFAGPDGLRAPDDPEFPAIALGDRADVFLSPHTPHAVVCELTGRSLKTSIVDLETRKATPVRMPGHHASAVAFAPDGRIAIARASFTDGPDVASEGILVLAADGSVVRRLPPATRGVRVLAFAAGGARLVYADDRLHLVALDTGEEIASADAAPAFWADLGEDAAVSHDGRTIRIHDPATLQPVKEFALDAPVPADAPERIKERGGLLRAALSKDGTLLAVATFDAVHFLRIERGK